MKIAILGLASIFKVHEKKWKWKIFHSRPGIHPSSLSLSLSLSLSRARALSLSLCKRYAHCVSQKFWKVSISDRCMYEASDYSGAWCLLLNL
jgi:hypothetical protein